MKFLIIVLLMLILFKTIMEVIFMAAVFKFSLKKLLLVMLTAAVILCCCTGCSSKETSCSEFSAEKTDVVFVLGCGNNRGRNLVQSAFENYKVRDVLDVVAEYGGTVTFITNEGEPQVNTTAIDPLSAAYSPAQKKKIVGERTAQIITAAKSAKAKTAETNLIKAVRTAGGCLANSNAKQKVIFIIDNALMQTDGIINLSTIDLTAVENNQIVRYLEEERVFDGYLDLDGAQIQWIGFSATGGSQREMTPEITLKMEELWTEVFAKAGAALTINSSVDTGGAQDNRKLPFVSAVYIPQETFDLAAVQRIDEDKLLFLPDSTEFADEQAADNTIMPFVNFLNSNPDVNVVIAGMTATQPNADACRELSYKRAEKVRDLMVEKGISADRIFVAGLGCEPNDYRTKDMNADGTFDEAAAKHNRCILIADADCDEGRELLKLGGNG